MRIPDLDVPIPNLPNIEKIRLPDLVVAFSVALPDIPNFQIPVIPLAQIALHWDVPDLKMWVLDVPNFLHLPAVVLPDCVLPELPNLPSVHLAVPNIDMPNVDIPKIDLEALKLKLPVKLPILDMNLIVETIKLDLLGLPCIPQIVFEKFQLLLDVPKINFVNIINLSIPIKFDLAVDLPLVDLTPPDFALFVPKWGFKMPKINLNLMKIPQFKFPKFVIPKPEIPKIEIPKIKLTPPPFAIRMKWYLLGLLEAILLLIPHFLELVMHFLLMLFNIVLVQLAFLSVNIPSITLNMPDLTEIIAAFENIFGDLAVIFNAVIKFFENLLKYLDILKNYFSFNCGGELTLFAPLLFFIG